MTVRGCARPVGSQNVGNPCLTTFQDLFPLPNAILNALPYNFGLRLLREACFLKMVGFTTDEIAAVARRSEMYRRLMVQFFRETTSSTPMAESGYSERGSAGLPVRYCEPSEDELCSVFAGGGWRRLLPPCGGRRFAAAFGGPGALLLSQPRARRCNPVQGATASPALPASLAL